MKKIKNKYEEEIDKLKKIIKNYEKQNLNDTKINQILNYNDSITNSNNKLTNQNEYDFFKDTIHGISHDNDQLPSYEDFCLKPDDCDINNQNLRKMFKDYLH